ncbi:unnamed protein product [Rhizophagus irregularis]|nr:unnamed protein product [Rhizophagus irregularis]
MYPYQNEELSQIALESPLPSPDLLTMTALPKLKHNFNNVVGHVYLIDSFKTTKSGDEFYEKSSFRQNNSDSFRIIVSFRELEWKVLIFLVDSKWNHRFFAC